MENAPPQALTGIGRPANVTPEQYADNRNDQLSHT
jgi:hypothetical protein